MDLWLIFLTGLTVGGLTCLAVQGGLLASTIAVREEEDLEEGSRRKHNLLPILSFLATKIIAYTVLGFILGAFGGALALSDSARILMQFLAGAYMIAIALNLLNIHPIFKYVVIQPPRFLTRMVKNTTRSKDIFAPALLGALTVFIPCGTTLAMEAFAISSGSPILGAAIMATFTLGTIPLFFGLGFLTTTLGDTFKTKFFKLAGVLVLYLGITSFNGALVLANSPVTLQTVRDAIPIYIDLSGEGSMGQSFVQLQDGIQVVDIAISPTSYYPNYIQVEQGIPVRLNLQSNGGLGCTSQFRIPTLGISKNIPQNGTAQINFTPSMKGKLTFTCSMGMYSGIIDVI
ncbi:sulfite exporter TauE/SafE family protein [Candidatus Daviesbacteria bacterium]|nr:sulfite exporter TauE/SafE family protein [Candidatus Daviesbacteria bacterium]